MARADAAVAAGRRAGDFGSANSAGRQRRLRLPAALRRHVLDAFASGPAGTAPDDRPAHHPRSARPRRPAGGRASCWPISASPRPSRFSRTSRRRAPMAGMAAPGPTAKPGAMSGMAAQKAGAAAAPDLNDVKYDAFLANFRTARRSRDRQGRAGRTGAVADHQQRVDEQLPYRSRQARGRPDRGRRFRGRADPRPPLPGRGRAAARHPGHAAAGAGRLSGPGAIGRRARARPASCSSPESAKVARLSAQAETASRR